MLKKRNKRGWWISLVIFFVSACAYPPVQKEQVTGPQNSLVKLKNRDIPDFSDDMDVDSLVTALNRSLHYLNKLPKDRLVYYGVDERTVGETIDSLETFLDAAQKNNNLNDIKGILRSHFDIYQPPPAGKKKEPVLFTGYYEPLLNGSLEETEKYQYPLYKKPADLRTLRLGIFHPRFKGKRLVGRIGNGTFVPYHTREAIDSKAILAGEGLELAWLADPVDRFFLHIQGSGKIRLRDDRLLNVNYAASNGREYRSIGRLLIKERIIRKEEVSLKSIKKFLRDHPEERERILNHNESYVFFREVEQGPIGAISEPVTPGRSIATDSALFPKGALAYIETEIPILDEKGDLLGWKKVSRFVFNQDTGGAIKGTGRVDLFFGSGDEAGKSAGYMNRKGRLYFLIKKSKNIPPEKTTASCGKLSVDC